MSEKEKAIEIINRLPESKLHYVLTFLQRFESNEDLEDDIICEKIYQQYLNNTDPEKHNSISLENFANEMGVSI